MITVAQLIDMLTRLPGDCRVVVRGYEEGADDVSPPRLVNLNLNVNEEEYYGPHAIGRPRRAGRLLHRRRPPR